jgi:hypothetical protein
MELRVWPVLVGLVRGLERILCPHRVRIYPLPPPLYQWPGHPWA